MLRVIATAPEGTIVAELEITRVSRNEDLGRYSVRAAVAEPHGTRYTQRNFAFPRRVGNYIGFIEAALLALDDEYKDFNGAVSSSDLARRLRRGVPEIQAWPGELRDNRSPLWGGQSEQSGSDSGRKEDGSEDR